VKNLAGIFFSIGLVYFGLHEIQINLNVLMKSITIENIKDAIQQSLIIWFIFGVIFSLIIHSALAVSILAIAMIKSDLIDFNSLMMIVYGANLGIGLLVYLGSVKTSGEFKQIIMYSILNKVIGTVLVLLLFGMEFFLEIPLVRSLIQLISNDVGIQTMLLYLTFNFLPLIIVLPYQDKILSLIERRYPPSLEDIYSKPQFVMDTKYLEPYLVLNMVEKEQERIIQTFQIYFHELRSGGNMKKLHILSNSIAELSKFIREETIVLIKRKVLTQDEHQKVHQLLISQNLINQCHAALLNLSISLTLLMKNREIAHICNAMIEAVDVINLILLDIVKEKNIDDLKILKELTKNKEGIQKMKQVYLNSDIVMSNEEKSELLEAINFAEIIIFLFVGLAEEIVSK
jgi:Na+/phosphate symporter